MILDEYVSNNKTKVWFQTLEQIFNETHNNKYDYTNSVVKNATTKIEVICLIHGSFHITPDSHKRGRGCPKCARNFKLNTSMFIEKSNKIHNSKYIYDKVEYKRWDVKVDIICTLHGIFKQTPNSHLHGCGCPSCGVITSSKITNYNRYKNKMTTLYYIKINNMYKIGLTRTSVESRFTVEIQNGLNIKILKTIEFEDGWKAYIIEQAVLAEATYGKISKDSSPITAGWTEIREMCFLDIIYKNLKEKNEENK